MKKNYGWIPDLPDHRDLKFIPRIDTSNLPKRIDLRPQCPPVVDQGELGSCTANAIAAAHQFEQTRQGKKVYVPDGKTGHNPFDYTFAPSRLFIYYNERLMEDTVDQDSGAQIRDGIKSLVTYGVCRSSAWPYHVNQFTNKPSDEVYAEAKLHGLALQYHSISNALNDQLACLAQGVPFVFGFTVYESFESDHVARTGLVPMPHKKECLLGGHAVLAVGYDMDRRLFIGRNSWGPTWGAQGYFYMPFDYLTNPDLSDDMWAITQVEK